MFLRSWKELTRIIYKYNPKCEKNHITVRQTTYFFITDKSIR